MHAAFENDLSRRAKITELTNRTFQRRRHRRHSPALKRSARYWTARNWAARKRAARDREQPLLPMPPAQDQKTEPKPKSRFLAQNQTETDRP